MNHPTMAICASLLGAFFFVRALLNLNQIHMRDMPLIAWLNLVLLLSGLALALSPGIGVIETLAAAIMVLVVFAACTLIGRWPGDKVLGRPH